MAFESSFENVGRRAFAESLTMLAGREVRGLEAADLDGDGRPDECAGSLFRRGDVDSSGVLNLSDALSVFLYLFLGGVAPACSEAADANNDRRLDITDGIVILRYLFLGGEAPAPPGPPPGPCGPDSDPPSSPGDQGCESYPAC